MIEVEDAPSAAAGTSKVLDWVAEPLLRAARLMDDDSDTEVEIGRAKLRKLTLPELNQRYRRVTVKGNILASWLLAERYTELGIPPAMRPLLPDRLKSPQTLDVVRKMLLVADFEWLSATALDSKLLTLRQRRRLGRMRRYSSRAAQVCKVVTSGAAVNKEVWRLVKRYGLPAKLAAQCAVLRGGGFQATLEIQRLEDRLNALLFDKSNAGGWQLNAGRFEPGDPDVIARRVFLWRCGELRLTAPEASRLWMLDPRAILPVNAALVRQDWRRTRGLMRQAERAERMAAKV